MDHHVEDDADVDAAVGIRRETGDLQEAGIAELLLEGLKSRIEALDVADLQDAVVRGRRGGEIEGLGGVRGYRLLDEKVLSFFQEQGAYLMVKLGRRGNRGNIDQIGKLIKVGAGLAAVFGGSLGGIAPVGVVDGDEFTIGKLAVDACVVDACCLGR